ncbi:phosphoribosylanthranilate isomerase, partial [Patescibacteria group bacterium]|nr:phosphoribosylanthranilate isomerase [Patescibacteria group bacterium]
MKAKVKICGIRDCEEAIICVDAGADFFGFNFIENSKRFIKPKDALKIIKMLPLRVKKVGVFRNESMERVNSLIKYLKLDFVQLHGDESPNYVSKINIVGKIKVFSLGKNFDVKDILNQVERYNTDYIFL